MGKKKSRLHSAASTCQSRLSCPGTRWHLQNLESQVKRPARLRIRFDVAQDHGPVGGRIVI